jgi:hypothetical protein
VWHRIMTMWVFTAMFHGGGIICDDFTSVM